MFAENLKEIIPERKSAVQYWQGKPGIAKRRSVSM